ncbi:MAG: flagellar basal body L-ring protein FlgH [Alphaproteobacteria bacterium]|jgi:flagellar L-ring protein FlgH|nr:flagellar basal body L-ring protein FlgH [Alphaproteobacteria bacterium]MBT7941993.1 flagellar basal body L-ring protein FlgH [Alphaproteobacteria bacterium]
MNNKTTKTLIRSAAMGLLAASVSACNLTSRLSEVGDGPKLTKITNPVARPSYRPVSLPMPAPEIAEDNPNSLWRAGARAFFKDHRAKNIGDIVTVNLDLDDSAVFNNLTERDRDDSEDTDVTNLLGLEAEFAKVLPQAIAPATVLSVGNKHSTSGDGTIDRSEVLSLTFAAVVTQILPNGSLVIVGRQEIKVNNEIRELMVTGVIRPSDIDSDNTIADENIAEMRVAYGGSGTLSQLQQPRWGTQIWDIIFPF